jgi:hypothetical protein
MSQLNTLVGAQTAYRLKGGDRNTCIGYRAGHDIETGSGNLYIGAYTADVFPQAKSDKFIIDYGGSGRPAIRGEFDTRNVGIGGVYDEFAGGEGVLAMYKSATHPVGGAANTAMFYVDGAGDVGEMWVHDSSGFNTQLSPHDHKTGRWFFRSENTKTGDCMRVDMEAFVEAVESLTGKRFSVVIYNKNMGGKGENGQDQYVA